MTTSIWYSWDKSTDFYSFLFQCHTRLLMNHSQHFKGSGRNQKKYILFIILASIRPSFASSRTIRLQQHKGWIINSNTFFIKTVPLFSIFHGVILQTVSECAILLPALESWLPSCPSNRFTKYRSYFITSVTLDIIGTHRIIYVGRKHCDDRVLDPSMEIYTYVVIVLLRTLDDQRDKGLYQCRIEHRYYE